MKKILPAIAPLIIVAILTELGLNAIGIIIVIFIICVIGYILVNKIETESSQRQRASDDLNEFSLKYSATLSEQTKAEKLIKADTPQIEELRLELKGEIGEPPTYQMILFAYLAKQGKIPSRGHLNSYEVSASPFSNFHDLINGEKLSKLGLYGGVYQDAVIHIRQARLKFLKWYDKELRSHGMKYKLMYVCRNSKDSGYHIKDAMWIDECTALGEDVAVFWTPMRLSVEDLIYINEYKYW